MKVQKIHFWIFLPLALALPLDDDEITNKILQSCPQLKPSFLGDKETPMILFPLIYVYQFIGIDDVSETFEVFALMGFSTTLSCLQTQEIWTENGTNFYNGLNPLRFWNPRFSVQNGFPSDVSSSLRKEISFNRQGTGLSL